MGVFRQTDVGSNALSTMINKIENYLAEVNPEKEFKKDKFKLTFLVSLEITLIILLLLIQEYLRPKTIFKSELGVFLMGTLPSFFGAMAYVIIIFVFCKLIQGHYQKFRLMKSLIIANCVSFFGLTIWEFIRTIITNFDWWDVAASLLGCFAATILIIMLYFNDNIIIEKNLNKKSET